MRKTFMMNLCHCCLQTGWWILLRSVLCSLKSFVVSICRVNEWTLDTRSAVTSSAASSDLHANVQVPASSGSSRLSSSAFKHKWEKAISRFIPRATRVFERVCLCVCVRLCEDMFQTSGLIFGVLTSSGSRHTLFVKLQFELSSLIVWGNIKCNLTAAVVNHFHKKFTDSFVQTTSERCCC